MAEIMEGLNTYVPVCKSPYNDENNNEENDDKILPWLLFGDQLSVARARSSAVLRQTHATPLKRLEGFIPCIAD